MKNLNLIIHHRVFWRAIGERFAKKNDTASRSMVLQELREDVVYEVAVKAGNHRGTSVLTPTITFHHSLSTVSSAITTRK